MTKILVVDDEPAQSRGLLRAILLRRPDYSVFTASSGVQAIAMLEEQSFDLVITDLQMAEMDGFDFLAWLLSQRRGVLAFAMTAYASDETRDRLRVLGAVECFNKPLDVDALLARILDGLAQNIRGQVHNVGLASFLQLIELEKKTCTLEVCADGQVGQLFVRRGELLDAKTAALSGEEAAVAILGWINASITIEGTCSAVDRVIAKPTYYVVMEAMRVRDESVRPRTKSGQPRANERRSSRPALCSDLSGLFGSERPVHHLNGTSGGPKALAGLHVPVGALALAVVDSKSGQALVVREWPELELSGLIQGALSVLQHQQTLLGRITGREDQLEELVTMTRSYGELVRPLPGGEAFILLVFDVAETNLVMARLELDLFAAEYAAA